MMGHRAMMRGADEAEFLTKSRRWLTKGAKRAHLRRVKTAFNRRQRKLARLAVSAT